MSSDEFNEKHKALLNKYDIYFEYNVDLWHMSTGLIYFDGEGDDSKFVTHITGISFNGGLHGDFEGFLANLEEAAIEFRALEVK